MALGMGSVSATQIILAANIPEATFVSSKAKLKADAVVNETSVGNTTPEALDDELLDDTELDDDELEDSIEAGEPEDSTPLLGPKATAAARRKERADKLAAAAHAKRFVRIRQNGYYGIFDNDSATQELFHSQEEADAYLEQLRHGREEFKVYYSSPAKSGNRSERMNYND